MNEAKPELRVVRTDDAGLATLALISKARESLAEARTLPDVRRVMEMAAVAKDAAQRAARLADAERLVSDVVASAGAAANDAAAVRMEAQAKAGELLKDMDEAGTRAAGRPEKVSRPSTLSDLGVSRDESSLWQRVAAIPAEDRAAYVEETKATKGEVSTAGLLKHVKSAARAVDGPPVAAGAEPVPAVSPRERLATDLLRAVDALLTFPPAMAAEVAGDDRVRLHRTVRRAAQWFGYLMRELHGRVPADSYERVEAAFTAVLDLHGLCAAESGVPAEALAGAVDANDRPEMLASVRAISGWLTDLEAELIRHRAEGVAET